MNTTPTTPERPGLSYTVVGGARPDRILSSPHRASLVLLNRGTRFERPDALRDVEALDVGEVISVERASVEVDNLSREHPAVRFVLVPEIPSVGELIDIGVAEARSRLVFVMWSDMRVGSPEELGRHLDAAEQSGALFVGPELTGLDGSLVPTVASPAFRGGRFTVDHAVAGADDRPTLYPFDYCGIYRKDRFLGIGGFDARIVSAYWQQLCFGLLAQLWGESLLVRRSFGVSYLSGMAPLDTTPDPSYRRFYLRSVAVRVGREGAYLPLARLLPFLLRSGTGIGTASREFREARQWVAARHRLYRRDVRDLVELWSAPR